MNYRIILSKPFLQEAKRLAKKYSSFKKDLEVLQQELKLNPYSGIDLGSGLRKVRMVIKSKCRGKSHGARVITYILLISEDEGEINLLTIYDKAERESISREEIEEIFLSHQVTKSPSHRDTELLSFLVSEILSF